MQSDRFRKLFLYLLFFLTAISTQSISGQNILKNTDEPFVLVLSSYNADNYRITGFIQDLEKFIYEKGHTEKILIEDLGYSTITMIDKWKSKMDKLLKRYDTEKLKGIILLGPEAWSTYLNLDTIYREVPYYVCFANKNTLKLPSQRITDEWIPENLEWDEKKIHKNFSGGFLREYDVENNIRLIRSLYPDTRHIAFLSDNSFGGISLQALIKKELQEKFPELNLISLDSRKENAQSLRKRIADLPYHTAILIGTWRIDLSGFYFSQHTLREIIPAECKIPAFTLTGLGLESVAIGGCIPEYEWDALYIANDMLEEQTFSLKNNSPKIFWDRNDFQFNRGNLHKFGIREYQLPPNSIIKNQLEGKIRKYQGFLYVFVCILILLSILLFRWIITEKRLIQKQTELQEALQRAEQSEKLKAAFLANMSHEIRTPLNAIVGFSELLINTEDPLEKDQYGHLIVHNNGLLLNLINDLLDLSKIEAGYMEFHEEYIDLNEIITDIHNNFHLRLNKEIRLICEIPEKGLQIKTDPQRLNQILSNYMTNAIKFTENGFIRIGYRRQDEGIYFFVTDTGIGISRENHHKVFSRFEKFDTFAQGTGLGLSICKAIAEARNGKVGFSSEAGAGSSFWCWLPCDITEETTIQ